MIDDVAEGPPVISRIATRAAEIGFDASCDPRTGSMLRTLAANRPGGRLLELGTGPGVSTAWLLDGMDSTATLTSVELETPLVEIAREFLGDDHRLTLINADGSDALRDLATSQFDLLFADTWPGKYWDLEEALALVAPGGLYVIDDMLPQSNWPAGHGEKVDALLENLRNRSDFVITPMNWASGLVIAARR
ncbi:MAG: methyltransferase domain-containing protein [Actinobacteria bacterium]|uniref:Unannotated protein n=1 Tax=freshwater metagenome TaxID=449393 RepID=A0A6J6W688_9ZZZZ|nr:methyltransferase domain-containing protein [Actinomycetota bacterium]